MEISLLAYVSNSGLHSSPPTRPSSKSSPATMSVAAMEDYKAKYAIHEACREGQSKPRFPCTLTSPHPCTYLSHIPTNIPQHQKSNPSSPQTPNSPPSGIPTTAYPSTGRPHSTTSPSSAYSCKPRTSTSTPQTAPAGQPYTWRVHEKTPKPSSTYSLVKTQTSMRKPPQARRPSISALRNPTSTLRAP